MDFRVVMGCGREFGWILMVCGRLLNLFSFLDMISMFIVIVDVFGNFLGGISSGGGFELIRIGIFGNLIIDL